MKMRLKFKYRVLAEPRKWLDRAGHKNMQKGRGKSTGNNSPKGLKGVAHPIGMSGRTTAVRQGHR